LTRGLTRIRKSEQVKSTIFFASLRLCGFAGDYDFISRKAAKAQRILENNPSTLALIRGDPRVKAAKI
jgi:hypothetical protein